MVKSIEIMCNASEFAIGIVLEQHIDNKQHVIYYSNKTLNYAQMNYITTEKEFLVVLPTWVQNRNFHRSFCA